MTEPGGQPPREPFIRPEWGIFGSNTAFAHTNPVVLFIDGVVCTIGGPVFAFVLYRVSPNPTGGLIAILVAFAVVIVVFGVLFFYAGARRAAWVREYERFYGRRPPKRS